MPPLKWNCALYIDTGVKACGNEYVTRAVSGS